MPGYQLARLSNDGHGNICRAWRNVCYCGPKRVGEPGGLCIMCLDAIPSKTENWVAMQDDLGAKQ